VSWAKTLENYPFAKLPGRKTPLRSILSERQGPQRYQCLLWWKKKGSGRRKDVHDLPIKDQPAYSKDNQKVLQFSPRCSYLVLGWGLRHEYVLLICPQKMEGGCSRCSGPITIDQERSRQGLHLQGTHLAASSIPASGSPLFSLLLPCT
jgi:hypothetical protein